LNYKTPAHLFLHGTIEYRFGSYDHERVDGELTWVPVTVKRYWQIKCDGLFFGDVDLEMSSDVIVDTGKRPTCYQHP